MKQTISFLLNCSAWAALLICWDINLFEINIFKLIVGTISFTALQIISDIARE